MNPWGFVVIGLGIIMIIIGVKGSQHNIVAALKGQSANTAGEGTSNVTLSAGNNSSGSVTVV